MARLWFLRLAFHFDGNGRTTSKWLWLFGIAVPSPALALMSINHISVHPGRLSDQLRALTAPLIIQFTFSLFCRVWSRSNSWSGEAQRAGSHPYPVPGTVALREAELNNEDPTISSDHWHY